MFMKVKKEYSNAMKDTLKAYPILLAHNKELQEELKYIKINSGIFGISYEQTRVQTSNINKMTENTALSNMDREYELQVEIIKCDEKIRIINDAIDQLPGLESQIVHMRYIKKFTWTKISIELYMTERNGRIYIKKGLANLAYFFYGDRALECSPSKRAS